MERRWIVDSVQPHDEHEAVVVVRAREDTEHAGAAVESAYLAVGADDDIAVGDVAHVTVEFERPEKPDEVDDAVEISSDDVASVTSVLGEK